MRTIKFRGKDVETGEWIYGDLFQRIGYYPEIIVTYPDDNGKIAYKGITVKPETIEQFTGLLDKDGKEIYEGDIVELREPNGMPNICKVEMCEKGYWCVSFGIHERIILGFIDKNQITVIGNIHDNPELLNNND